MKHNKAKKTPYAFVQKSWMHRCVWINCYTLLCKECRRIFQSVVNFRRPHSEQRRVGVSAKRFLIEEVAPSANTLSNQQTERTQIKKIEKINFANFTTNCRTDESTNDTAINCNTAIPYCRNFVEMLRIIFPLKRNIIQSCANNTKQCAPNENIGHSVKAHFPFVRLTTSVQNRK